VPAGEPAPAGSTPSQTDADAAPSTTPAVEWFGEQPRRGPTHVYRVAEQAHLARERTGNGTAQDNHQPANHWRTDQTLESLKGKPTEAARARSAAGRMSWLNGFACGALACVLAYACREGRWEFAVVTLLLLAAVVGAFVAIRRA